MPRSLSSASIKERVRHNSIRRGLLGGDRFWMVVFGLGRLAQVLGTLTKRGEMVVAFSERLRPGAALEIRHVEAPARRGRRS